MTNEERVRIITAMEKFARLNTNVQLNNTRSSASECIKLDDNVLNGNVFITLPLLMQPKINNNKYCMSIFDLMPATTEFFFTKQ